MNQAGSATVSTGRRALRRFPGLTEADMAVLRALGPAEARAFERELRAQLRSDERHRRATDAAVAAAKHRPTGRRIPTHLPHD